jgi:hypothetical protein
MERHCRLGVGARHLPGGKEDVNCFVQRWQKSHHLQEVLVFSLALHKSWQSFVQVWSELYLQNQSLPSFGAR